MTGFIIRSISTIRVRKIKFFVFLPSPAVIRRILPLSAVSGPFQMLYLCIVFERPKLRVRVLTIFPTCTSKISYVYPHPGPLRHKSSLTLLTGRSIVLNLSHTDLTDPTDDVLRILRYLRDILSEATLKH